VSGNTEDPLHPLGNEFHNRMRSTSLSVISSFVRS
jgi:hypothetical protein